MYEALVAVFFFLSVCLLRRFVLPALAGAAYLPACACRAVHWWKREAINRQIALRGCAALRMPTLDVHAGLLRVRYWCGIVHVVVARASGRSRAWPLRH